MIGRMRSIFKQLPKLFTRAKKPRTGIDIFDLLGREPICLDTPELQRFLAGKSILVTGAGASIGSEILRQAIEMSPSRLVLVHAGGNALFGEVCDQDGRPVESDITPCPPVLMY